MCLLASTGPTRPAPASEHCFNCMRPAYKVLRPGVTHLRSGHVGRFAHNRRLVPDCAEMAALEDNQTTDHSGRFAAHSWHVANISFIIGCTCAACSGLRKTIVPLASFCGSVCALPLSCRACWVPVSQATAPSARSLRHWARGHGCWAVGGRARPLLHHCWYAGQPTRARMAHDPPCLGPLPSHCSDIGAILMHRRERCVMWPACHRCVCSSSSCGPAGRATVRPPQCA